MHCQIYFFTLFLFEYFCTCFTMKHLTSVEEAKTYRQNRFDKIHFVLKFVANIWIELKVYLKHTCLPHNLSIFWVYVVLFLFRCAFFFYLYCIWPSSTLCVQIFCYSNSKHFVSKILLIFVPDIIFSFYMCFECLDI